MAVRTWIGSWLGEIFNPIATADRETGVLAPRTLRLVRAAVLVVFAAAVAVYAFDLFALWDEARALQTSGPPDEYGETTTYNYFGLTAEERELAGGSTSETPQWYPVFIVGRQVILVVVALAISWLIYSRRPKHGMAYLTTLFILLGPIMGLTDEDTNRLDGTVLFVPREVLSYVALAVFLSFLWLFPDGRFRGALIKFVASVLGFIAALFIVGQVLSWFGVLESEAVATATGSDTTTSVSEFVGTLAFLPVLAAVLFWAVMGISLQVWRYQNTPLPDRRLARWNLAFLIAIPLWIMPFEALHELFSDTDVGRYTLSGFIWEQIHETLYVAAPAAFGIWVLHLIRRQGWWDFQTLWNRTAIYGIGLLILGALYVGAFGLVTVLASPLTDTGEQVIAVLAATAAVAFAYGPLLGRIRRWVDDRWFPRRAEVDAIARSFADELRVVNAPETVPDHLRAAVQKHLDPQHVRLWSIGGELR